MTGRGRRPFLAGNWKLHHTIADSTRLASSLAGGLADVAASTVDVAVAPVFTALAAVHAALQGSPIALAAQDLYWEETGAFTGEVGPLHLRDAGCRYAIVGHSERRQLFGEEDGQVRRKATAALTHGLTPIVCVGESLETREAGRAEPFVVQQVRAVLADMTSDQRQGVVLAYEPIWAIGTGRTASPADAQAMHDAVRRAVGDLCGSEIALAMRILYGGSVKPDNAADLLAQPDVDGALVGGASLTADSFSAIVRAAVF